MSGSAPIVGPTVEELLERNEELKAEKRHAIEHNNRMVRRALEERGRRRAAEADLHDERKKVARMEQEMTGKDDEIAELRRKLEEAEKRAASAAALSSVQPPQPLQPAQPVQLIQPPQPPQPVQAVQPPQSVQPPPPVQAAQQIQPPPPVQAAQPPQPVLARRFRQPIPAVTDDQIKIELAQLVRRQIIRTMGKSICRKSINGFIDGDRTTYESTKKVVRAWYYDFRRGLVKAQTRVTPDMRDRIAAVKKRNGRGVGLDDKQADELLAEINKNLWQGVTKEQVQSQYDHM